MPNQYQNLDFETAYQQYPCIKGSVQGPFTIVPGMEIVLSVDGVEVTLPLDPADTNLDDIIDTLDGLGEDLVFYNEDERLVIESQTNDETSRLRSLGGTASALFGLPTGVSKGGTQAGEPNNWDLYGSSLMLPLELSHKRKQYLEPFDCQWEGPGVLPSDQFSDLDFTVGTLLNQPVETFFGHTPSTIAHYNPIQPNAVLTFAEGFISTFALDPLLPDEDLRFGDDGLASVCVFEPGEFPAGDFPIEFGYIPGTVSTETFDKVLPGHVRMGQLDNPSGAVVLSIEYTIGSVTNTLRYLVPALSFGVSNPEAYQLTKMAEFINNDQTPGFFQAVYSDDPAGLWITCKTPGVKYRVDGQISFNAATRYPSESHPENWWWYNDRLEGYPYQITEQPLTIPFEPG